MTNDAKPVPQLAIWYFVGATFVFATPVIIFQGDAHLAVTISSLVVGLALIVLGGIQLGREITQRRERANRPPQI